MENRIESFSAYPMTLISFFKGEYPDLPDNFNFVIPDFQRNFVWDRPNFKKLLKDICVSEKYGNEHFIGTIYCCLPKNTRNDFVGEKDLIIIDGQQRITTIFLILLCLMNNKAVADEYKTRLII